MGPSRLLPTVECIYFYQKEIPVYILQVILKQKLFKFVVKHDILQCKHSLTWQRDKVNTQAHIHTHKPKHTHTHTSSTYPLSLSRAGSCGCCWRAEGTMWRGVHMG